MQNDIKMIKHEDGVENLEERVPMLANQISYRGSNGCVILGDYDIHMRTHLMQARQCSASQDGLLCNDGTYGGGDATSCCPVEDNKYVACECVTTAPICRTYSRPKESIYDTNLRVHKVKCPTVPNPNAGVSYSELDPKTLNERQSLPCDNSGSLPGPDIVTVSGQRKSSRESILDASESENELNRIREQAS